jgi:nicotinamidase-related amidase
MAGQSPDPFAVRLSSAAFIIVDMQNDFVRVGAPLEVPDTRATIEPIKAVSRLFREAKRPVVYTGSSPAPRRLSCGRGRRRSGRRSAAAGSGFAVTTRTSAPSGSAWR